MGMLQEGHDIDIFYVDGHYQAYVKGKFIVSGDTVKEVCLELQEMGYLDGHS